MSGKASPQNNACERGIARRPFLRYLAVLSGAAAVAEAAQRAAATPWPGEAAEPESERAPAVHTNSKTSGRRGAVHRVGNEIQEARDPETGARVRRLTADGADNVHLYFTSESFLDGGADMSLITHAQGRARVRRLCRRTPGASQYSHGHPVFSLDDQWVLYNSMIGPTHNVYMADVTSLA